MHYIADNHHMKVYSHAGHQHAYEFYPQMHGVQGIQHYAVNFMLYLRTVKDKYIEIYNEFIS